MDISIFKFWGKWATATIVGYILSFFAYLLLGFSAWRSTYSQFDTWLSLIGVGFLVSLLQSEVLRKKVDIFILWIIATVLGWAIGIPVAGFFAYQFGWMMFAPFFGLCIGISQWLVLRQKFHLSGVWVLVPLITWMLSLSAIGDFLLKNGDVDGAGFLLIILPAGLTFIGLVESVLAGGVITWLVHKKYEAVTSKP